MKNLTLKEKVKSCADLCGTHINVPGLYAVDIMGRMGYDFLWIDLEHTHISLEDCYNLILASKAIGTSPIVRVPMNDLTFTKRVVEMGPDGIIFPMVHNAKEANELLSWTLYPPYGKRGCGPKGAVEFNPEKEKDYFDKGHLNMCRFLQIEQSCMLDDLEEIAANPYLDGFIFGMMDLSGSFNKLGETFCDECMDMAKKSIEIAQKYKKTVGVSVTGNDVELLKKYHDMGINMISAGADFDYIRRGALENIKNIKLAQNN